jgi:hypothetical protein
MPKTEKLVIDNLVYEELIMLQEILLYLENSGQSDMYDADIFADLYEKVMTS